MIESFKDIEDARALAQAIVDTVREPMLVLDGDPRVLAVSRSFYMTFQVHQEDVLGRPLYALGDGQWHIPALRMHLEKIIQERAAMDAFEVEHEFPKIGRRIMLLNARSVFYADHSHTTLLLAFEDVTERRAIEREKEELLRQTEELLQQKTVLFREMEHRVANSLQIIASILMLKARTVTSKETRLHLQDAHQRVMAVAAVQQHLHASESYDQIEIGPYLSSLCKSLTASMIGERAGRSRWKFWSTAARPSRQGRQPRPYRHRARDQRFETRISQRQARRSDHRQLRDRWIGLEACGV